MPIPLTLKASAPPSWLSKSPLAVPGKPCRIKVINRQTQANPGLKSLDIKPIGDQSTIPAKQASELDGSKRLQKKFKTFNGIDQLSSNSPSPTN